MNGPRTVCFGPSISAVCLLFPLIKRVNSYCSK